MKKLFKLSAFVLLGIALISGRAFAAVTHADGDKYGDSYTVENSSGNWTMAGNVAVQGTLNNKRPVVVINDPAATAGSVTLALSGDAFVLTAPAAGKAYPSGAGMTLTLPSTNSTVAGSFTGETFTFSTATGSTLSIRTASATDATIMYGVNNCTRITSPASTGSTVTVVGNGSYWFISSMAVGSDKSNTWTAGSF